MRKKSKVYIRMFLSYIAILVISMILAVVLYTYTFGIIRQQAEKMNQNLLAMVQQELDQEVDYIEKVVTRMALDTKVQLASSVRGDFTAEDQMNLYYIYQDCESLKMDGDLVNDVFVMFNNTDKVVSSRGNMSVSMFYHIYYKSDELTLKQFNDYMKEHHYQDILPIRKNNGEEVLLYTMTLLNRNLSDSAAVICAEIPFKAVKERLQTMKWAEQMDVLVLLDTNQKICADEAVSDNYELKFHEQEAGNHRAVNDRGENYIISVLPSASAPWKYLSIMPMEHIEKEAQKVRSVAMAGLFLCTIMGVFISYYVTKRNYNPLKVLLETFKKHGNVEIGEEENEYQWLNSQMDSFFKRHVDAEQLISKNQKTLKNYYLQQFLQMNCEKGAPEQYGIRLKEDYNVVLLFTPVNTAMENLDAVNEIDENALQKFIIINMFEEMCLEYYNMDMVEMGERAAAIVSVPDRDRSHIDILKALAENLQQTLEKTFGFSTVVLCGDICPGWSGIHTSYIQAMKLTEYVHLLDASLVVYDEVKEIRPQYRYPIEMEQRIINAIKVGDSQAACKTMEEVFALNMQGKVTANVYRCLIYGMIGTLLEGASQGGYQEAAGELQFPDGNSAELPVGNMKEQFEQLAEQICAKIKELQKETAQDQTLSKQVQEFIFANYQDPDLNISITSQHFDLTPAYLSSVYKKQTGGSLLEFINTVRISRAEQFLEQGYSVVEVAQMTGYRDSGTFIRAFKKKVGVTPGQLKKKI